MLINNNLSVLRERDGMFDLIGKQGTTWGPLYIALTIDGVAVDLAGYSVRGQMRKKMSSAMPEAGLLFTIEDEPGGIIAMSMAAEDNAKLSCGPTVKDAASIYVWDMEIYKDSPPEVSRPLGGKIYIDPEVSRAEPEPPIGDPEGTP